jgi:hypothetical protein
LDGGTDWFVGRGYSVYRLHSLISTKDREPLWGYLGGAELHWWFPLRVFALDYHSCSYIPEKN